MQIHSFKAILAAAAVVSFASACTSKGHDEIKAGVSAKVADLSTMALNAEMKNYEPGFDITQTFLASKIESISIDSIAQNTFDASSVGQGTFTLSGNLILRGEQTVYKLVSGSVSFEDLRGGKTFDVEVQDPSESLESELGGLLSVKARCMDADCKTVSMWLNSFQTERINSTGVIFSLVNGKYSITNSMGINSAVGQAFAKNVKPLPFKDGNKE